MVTPPAPSQSSPITIEFDADRRIVRIHFRGVVTKESARGHHEQVAAIVAKLGPGFTLVTDLTALQEMDLDTVPILTRVMDLCLAAGVQQIVRIIPDPSKDIGFHLLSLTHYRGRVPIVVCASVAEAERTLDASQGARGGGAAD